jgi:hypothetical protein
LSGELMKADRERAQYSFGHPEMAEKVFLVEND